MGLRFELDFFGDQQVSRTLVRISENVQDARPAWEAIADDLQQAESQQFATEGGFGSGGWSPLSPRYAAWKARHYPGAPILVRTGLLRDSLTQRPFGVEDLEKQRMAVGSDVEHGRFHQRGDGVPTRKPVELPESTRRQMTQRVQQHIFGSMA